MNSRVRIVKRGSNERPQNLQISAEGRAAESPERKIAKTVRSWIAEREKQRRVSERRRWEILTALANGTLQ